MNKKQSITKSEIINYINDLPNIIIPLSGDALVALYPNQIIENIENKTRIGKLYYIQIGKIVYNNKKLKNKSIFEEK